MTKRLGASGGAACCQAASRSLRTTVSSSSAIRPMVSATICTAVMDSRRDQPVSARRSTSAQPPRVRLGRRRAASQTPHMASSTKARPATTKPPSASSDRRASPTSQNSSRPKAPSATISTSQTDRPGAPRSRRSTRNGVTPASRSTGTAAKPSTSTTATSRACSAGQAEAAGSEVSSITRATPVSAWWATQPRMTPRAPPASASQSISSIKVRASTRWVSPMAFRMAKPSRWRSAKRRAPRPMATAAIRADSSETSARNWRARASVFWISGRPASRFSRC